MLKPLVIAAALTAGLAAPAFAQSDIFSAAAFSGRIDLRLAAADGETTWVDGGFGKSRFGGSPAGDWKADAQVADAILQWRPAFSWGLSGVVDVEYQSDQDKPFGVTEAFLQFKPLTSGSARYSARVGMFYPPVSLEHDGPAWTVSRTITPSAINSWISEEVKGAGVEGGVRRAFGQHELGLTLGAFGYNDTAGTLLSLRGWSLNDERATVRGDYPLPPLSPFLFYRQRARTTPSLELDHRVGYYWRADWRPPARVAFNAVHYDNQGDMVGVNSQVEWSWRTQFTDLGAVWKPADNTEVLAQAMWGYTKMGYPFPSGIWVDVDYSAAYVLVSQTFGASALTGRLDTFSEDDQAPPSYGDNSENGWALTAAWRRTLNPNAQVLLEVSRTDSNRPSRVQAGVSPRQTQTVIQASTRLSF